MVRVPDSERELKNGIDDPQRKICLSFLSPRLLLKSCYPFNSILLNHHIDILLISPNDSKGVFCILMEAENPY